MKRRGGENLQLIKGEDKKKSNKSRKQEDALGLIKVKKAMQEFMSTFTLTKVFGPHQKIDTFEDKHREIKWTNFSESVPHHTIPGTARNECLVYIDEFHKYFVNLTRFKALGGSEEESEKEELSFAFPSCSSVSKLFFDDEFKEQESIEAILKSCEWKFGIHKNMQEIKALLYHEWNPKEYPNWFCSFARMFLKHEQWRVKDVIAFKASLEVFFLSKKMLISSFGVVPEDVSRYHLFNVQDLDSLVSWFSETKCVHTRFVYEIVPEWMAWRRKKKNWQPRTGIEPNWKTFLQWFDNQARGLFPTLWNKRRAEGTLLHKYIELFLLKQLKTYLNPLFEAKSDDDEFGAISSSLPLFEESAIVLNSPAWEQFLCFYENEILRKDLVFAAAEQKIFYDFPGTDRKTFCFLAGTVDSLFYRPSDKTYHLKDWKHIQSDQNLLHYVLVLNLYNHILETKYLGKSCSSLELVIFHKTQKDYVTIDVPFMPKSLVADILNVWERHLRHQPTFWE